MKKEVAAICILGWLGYQPIPAHSFELNTHRAMSERAVGTVGNSTLDTFLKNHLSFRQGIEDEIRNGDTTLSVKSWIREGAAFEDSPSVRVRHHFHNPTRPWDQAGLRVLGIEIGESSVLWGQDRGQIIGGKHSWHDARTSFHQALTATTDAARQNAYTATFQSLGQLIHLIQDAASPAHTRNDAHLCCVLGVGDRDEFHSTLPVRSERDLL